VVSSCLDVFVLVTRSQAIAVVNDTQHPVAAAAAVAVDSPPEAGGQNYCSPKNILLENKLHVENASESIDL